MTNGYVTNGMCYKLKTCVKPAEATYNIYVSFTPQLQLNILNNGDNRTLQFCGT